MSLGGAIVGADLSGSSKYSNENFEGRRGERKSEDIDRGPGKSYLFFLRPAHPRNGSAGGKGSQQNRSVTLRKGLALRAGHRGPSPKPVGCQWTARAALATRAGFRVLVGGWIGSSGALPLFLDPRLTLVGRSGWKTLSVVEGLGPLEAYVVREPHMVDELWETP
ncbi:hypothetical protein RJT34_20694 [Clitoria ternatea]|uniref:Uncharacterized protein n=1 Tax=Clitoria ternatea TaxID=43366 RepID=A0AAN9IUD0_CLITE